MPQVFVLLTSVPTLLASVVLSYRVGHDRNNEANFYFQMLQFQFFCVCDN